MTTVADIEQAALKFANRKENGTISTDQHGGPPVDAILNTMPVDEEEHQDIRYIAKTVCLIFNIRDGCFFIIPTVLAAHKVW